MCMCDDGNSVLQAKSNIWGLGYNGDRGKNSSSKVPYLESPTLILPIHYATFMGLRWWLRLSVVYSWEPPFFLSYLGWHTLPSHASAEACLTGWPNAQPLGRDWCSVARHHQANLMVCVVCICCATSPYREVCRAKGGIRSGETLCHNIYPARPITTV